MDDFRKHHTYFIESIIFASNNGIELIETNTANKFMFYFLAIDGSFPFDIL